MKKTIGIILAIAVLAMGMFLFLKIKVRPTGTEAESLVPASALVYISQREIGGDWEKLKASGFWKELTSSGWWPEWELQIEDLKGKMESKWGVSLKERDILEILGREVAIILLPGEREDLQPRGLLLTRVGMKTKVEERLAKMQDNLFGRDKLRSETYEGIEITTLETSSPGIELSYAFLGDWLVLGVGKNNSALKESVNIYRGRSRASLMNDENFQEVRSKLPEERAGLFYINMEKTLASYPEGTIEKIAKGEAPLKDLNRRMKSSLEMIKTMGMATWFDRGLKAKFCMLLNREEADENLLEMYTWKPRKSESIKYLPKGTVIYAGNNSFDVGAYWKYLRKTLKKQDPQVAEQMFRGVERLKTEWGLSLEDDILSWMGNEFAYALSEVDMEGPFPRPGYFLMLKVKDDKKARETLAKVEDILEKAGLEKGLPFPLKFGEENYAGEEIKFLQVPISLTPGYAFIDDFLVISTNTSTIRKLIDTKRGEGASLTQDANFKRVESIFGKKSNSLCYVNIEKSLDIVHGLTGWVLSMREGQLSRIKKRKAALESREFETSEEKEKELRACQRRLDTMKKQVNSLRDNLEKKVYPLLESLKVLKSSGINVVIDKKGAEETFYLAVEE